jgi:adenylate cyclase
VDVFAGANSGLVVAEIELRDENEPFQLPAWVGAEISADTRFLAMNLARSPYSGW